MRVLIINDEIKKKIKNVISYAKCFPFEIKDMKKLSSGQIGPPGDNQNYSVELFSGYRVVFSFEEHPSGWYKHLSVSVDTEGKLPSIPSVEVILQEFGFGGNLTIMDMDNVWIEKGYAVNIVKKLEPGELE
jgi:hypothetical protein